MVRKHRLSPQTTNNWLYTNYPSKGLAPRRRGGRGWTKRFKAPGVSPPSTRSAIDIFNGYFFMTVCMFHIYPYTSPKVSYPKNNGHSKQGISRDLDVSNRPARNLRLTAPPPSPGSIGIRYFAALRWLLLPKALP